MSYTKHNFTSGEVLYASQMRDIDDAIYSLDGRVGTVESAATNLSNLSTIRTDLDNTIVVGRQRMGESNQNADLYMDPGTYVVDYGCANTPYHDTRYYDYNLDLTQNCIGIIFVYGFRDKVNTAANFLCQIFIEGPRTLTASEALAESMRQVSDPSYSFPIGRIFTRYFQYSNNAGTWSRWYGYPNAIEMYSQLSSIRDRLDVLEGNSGSGNEEQEKD